MGQTVQDAFDAAVGPLLHTVEDAARLLGVSRAHLYTYIASGELETVSLGRARRIPHDALVAFVERLRVAERA